MCESTHVTTSTDVENMEAVLMDRFEILRVKTTVASVILMGVTNKSATKVRVSNTL